MTDGRFVYSWNGENRLVSAVETGKQKIDFIYDYMGRRINKKVYSWNGSAWTLDSETKFVYDRYNIVAEFDGSNNLLNSYLWGEDVSGSLEGAGGVGGLLAVNNYLPIFDGNGNITTYLDNSGNVVATYEYDPFGKIICAFGTKADDMLFRFSTKYFDKETGMYYYGYRYYNAGLCRWLNRDPIEEAGFRFINKIKLKSKDYGSEYIFANNNLINNLDFLGLIKYRITIALFDKVTDVVPNPVPVKSGVRYKLGEKDSYRSSTVNFQHKLDIKKWATEVDETGGWWYEPDHLLVMLEVLPEKDKEELCEPFVYSIETIGGSTKTGNFNVVEYNSATNSKGITGSLLWDKDWVRHHINARFDIPHRLFSFNDSNDYVYARIFSLDSLKTSESVKIIVEDYNTEKIEKEAMVSW